MPDKTPPAGQQPTLRVVPMPADANASGDIFGGWIMAQVDIAGGVVAARRAQGRVVTVAVHAFQFRKPVFVGDLVSVYAEVAKTGQTSITVDVTVYVERGLLNAGNRGDSIMVTEATLTYVAIDPAGAKRPLPPA